jgi:hypothetical protein
MAKLVGFLLLILFSPLFFLSGSIYYGVEGAKDLVYRYIYNSSRLAILFKFPFFLALSLIMAAVLLVIALVPFYLLMAYFLLVLCNRQCLQSKKVNLTDVQTNRIEERAAEL